MELKEAEKVMEKFNESFKIIEDKKNEFENLEWKSAEDGFIYVGLKFAYIEMCKLQGELEKILIE